MSQNDIDMTRRALFTGAATSLGVSVLASAPVAAAQSAAAPAGSDARRRADLEFFLKVFPPSRPPASGRMNAHDKVWEDWVKRTGELPPDFASMPSIPGLPDPLVLREGGREVPVTNAVLWNRQKQWIRAQFEQWVFGTMPPAPDNLRAVVTGTRLEGTATVRDVRLEFGPGHRATLRLQLAIPEGKGPFPVFLTDHNRRRPWLYTAVKRGYIACYYAAADPVYGDGDDSDAYIEVYPDYDFSCLARWGWSASRAVDYLVTLPEVAKDQIGLTGHSRGGKQALVGAAFDERIGAVIASSGNTGECDPWRYTTDMFVNESIQLLTAAQPHWFQPRLRFFAGREDKLPVDQNMLMALMAPRGLMMYAGYAESAGNPFGFEQAYRSVLSVYRFLGREENLWLNLREGEHPTNAADIEQFVDFFDSVFGRHRRPKLETWICGYTFDRWREITKEDIDPLSSPKRAVGDFGSEIESASDWEGRRKSIRQTIAHVLGEAPPVVPFDALRNISETNLANEGWLATLYNRPLDDRTGARFKSEGMGVLGLPFGDGLQGDLYYPAGADGKPKPGRWPVIVWLHPFSYQNGWSAGRPWLSGGWAYQQDQRPSFPMLVKKGVAVFAFDQIGFGTRIHEAKAFYERYPKWSLLGNMIADARAAVGALSRLQEIDSSKIFLLGYALGGKVGLLTAAFEDRIKGVISVCGLDPLRLYTSDKSTEGIRQYSHLHGLLPRLGFFVNQQDRVPFDFDEVLALIAPKPALVMAPTLDRYARLADVEREVEGCKRIYSLLGQPGALSFETPADFNRFSRRMQERVLEWLTGYL